MKKVVFIVMMILILIYGCGEKEFRFYHDIDEIERIEIVSVKFIPDEGIVSQDIICSVEDINAFINDFKDLEYDSFFGNPRGIVKDEIVIKITYTNDEYELIDSIGGALYFNETGLKNYKGYHVFIEEEFSELIEKYMNND